ncbi:hypothetical protein B9T36_00690 [Acinetobacter sp. ANC 4204]|uniref:hypothetical protein n=1 Tax=Acinetobacter sp. ANC 4204 TaxID=1977884 RepID=UPI000A3305CC|nr:hypothetical protein [Acinetobacter sp. ANC 4204]OTG60965.1 hypothetical protein B9T36_00690 [Acinetobacter sp. ANC 4204]
MKRIPCEADLMSADGNTYGNALARCQSAAQDCPELGFCRYDGECFNKLTHEEAVERLEVVEKELADYKTKWEKLNAKNLHLIASLKASLGGAIRDGLDERVFAYRSCLAMLERVL